MNFLDWLDFLFPIIRQIAERCGEQRARAELDNPGRRVAFSIVRANRQAGLRGQELRQENQRALTDLTEMLPEEKDDLIAIAVDYPDEVVRKVKKQAKSKAA